MLTSVLCVVQGPGPEGRVKSIGALLFVSDLDVCRLGLLSLLAQCQGRS